MRLATRTGLAAFVGASITLLLVAGLFRGSFANILQDRVDSQLKERAETAPILAAVADRLAQSELRTTLEGARVRRDGDTIALGLLPAEPLPDTIEPGWSTARASGDRWRLYTVEVVDVPEPGDHAFVQLVAPLGDADARAAQLRRRALLIVALTSIAAGLVGYLLGSIATRPLTALRGDTERIEEAEPETWKVGRSYGSVEVDDVAATLNENLNRLAEETRRRGAALEAARSFAAAATHELRTPLQGALINLDIARSGRVDETGRAEALELADEQLQRMGASLAAVRALADSEFADRSWFHAIDLADVADAAVADERRRAPHAIVEIESTPPTTTIAWRDGVNLAIANIVRNALIHGAPSDGTTPHVVVTVAGATVTVDDNGPGVAPADRQRVMQRFERGSGGGSGLGLAIAQQVAIAHGGSVHITESPLGGARVVMTLAASAQTSS
ncbi:MAG TPA: HAMP domain-containing sensor histidine kinase [Ilumatobacteraceae bacterium]|nr:HAMP domain-containing sensor histidine kinase [Ilumatobacteraceae bacterium]